MSGRVLVTGGTGAAGAATVKWLRRMGADVVVLARRTPAVARPRRDVCGRRHSRRRRSIARGSGLRCDSPLRLDGLGDAERGRRRRHRHRRHHQPLRAMADHDCRRMVFASSITVYGGHADHPQPFTEDETPAAGGVFPLRAQQGARGEDDRRLRRGRGQRAPHRDRRPIGLERAGQHLPPTGGRHARSRRADATGARRRRRPVLRAGRAGRPDRDRQPQRG